MVKESKRVKEFAREKTIYSLCPVCKEIKTLMKFRHYYVCEDCLCPDYRPEVKTSRCSPLALAQNFPEAGGFRH